MSLRLARRYKHRRIRTDFNLKAQIQPTGAIRWLPVDSKEDGVIVTVRPFNAETTRKHQRLASWSHGFTHFEIKEWNSIGFCGISLFERMAEKRTDFSKNNRALRF